MKIKIQLTLAPVHFDNQIINTSNNTTIHKTSEKKQEFHL